MSSVVSRCRMPMASPPMLGLLGLLALAAIHLTSVPVLALSMTAARLHSVHSDPPRAKILHLVRHAEGTHNVCPDNGHSATHLDAPLTAEGVEQCLRLEATTRSLDVDCIICSPMTRCLQTAQLSFKGALSRRRGPVPFVAHEEWRETVNFLCDKRRDTLSLKSDFPSVDFGRVGHDVDPIWRKYEADLGPADEFKSLRESADAKGLETRARAAWRVVSQRPERSIAIVSHSALFMHMFTPLFKEMEGVVSYEDEAVRALMEPRFENCEMRSVALVSP